MRVNFEEKERLAAAERRRRHLEPNKNVLVKMQDGKSSTAMSLTLTRIGPKIELRVKSII